MTLDSHYHATGTATPGGRVMCPSARLPSDRDEREARDVSFRFVHAADFHLDSPFTGIRETEPHVADILRRATFEAYARVIIC